MSETLVIILGVTVFVTTFLGVLIYFYSVVAALEEASDRPDGGARPPRASSRNL